MKTRARLGMALGSIALVAGIGLVTAAPAEAATYHVSLSTWKAYNYADSAGSIRHFDRTTSGTRYANWAGRGAWSTQGACWSGVTGYGFQY